MKNIQLPLKFLIVLAVGVLFSCSADYDYSVDLSTENLKYISLTANTNHSVMGIDQTLNLTVTDDNSGEDYTEAATISINGEAISGNAYNFQEAGTYEISASIDDLHTNSLNIRVVDGQYVTVTPEKALRGEEVTFNFYDANGQDLTETTNFFVNEEAVSGNTFQTNEIGDFEVNAQYQGNTSPNTPFEVFTPKRKVALEDYTGDWCGWCPRVLLVVEEVEAQTDNTVVLAVHKNDDMEFSQADALLDAFDVGSSLPKLRANRTENIVVGQDSDIPTAVDYIVSQAGTEVSTSIAIDTKLHRDELKVAVKLRSEEAIPDTYKLAVYLYQNGLVYPQTNYYNNTEGSKWYQQGNPIPDFVHNHVLETTLTDNVLGEAVEGTPAYETYTNDIGTVDLSSFAHTDGENTYNPENFGVAVYLVDQNNNAINAQSVKAGEQIGFE